MKQDAQKYLSATYSGKYSFSNYDKFRSRTSNSILLNAKNKLFGWQLNVGQNYREGFRNSTIADITGVNTENVQRGYFMKSALTFDIGKDRLLVNYDLNHNNNDAYTNSFGFLPVVNPMTQTITGIADYTTDDEGKTLNTRHDASATYQLKFDNRAKKLDLNVGFNQFDTKYNQNSLQFLGTAQNPSAYETTSQQNIYTMKVDYSQPLKILDEGKISVGGLYEKLNFDTQLNGFTNLDYQRQTASAYTELQAKLKKFDFILGTRAESYDISGLSRLNTNGSVKETALIPFNQFHFFPNASVQYNFMPRIYLAFNYNKKIQLPNISWLNPNNTNYQGGNISFGGNVNLQPTIFDNYEIKLSAFDYAFMGYNLSVAKNQ